MRPASLKNRRGREPRPAASRVWGADGLGRGRRGKGHPGTGGARGLEADLGLGGPDTPTAAPGPHLPAPPPGSAPAPCRAGARSWAPSRCRRPADRTRPGARGAGSSRPPLPRLRASAARGWLAHAGAGGAGRPRTPLLSPQGKALTTVALFRAEILFYFLRSFPRTPPPLPEKKQNKQNRGAGEELTAERDFKRK